MKASALPEVGNTITRELAWFTPWPPKPNGIADYSFRVARELAKRHAVVAYSDMNAPTLPAGVTKRSITSNLSLPSTCCPIYQIGNNFDHIFVYQQAISTPGIVVLHDLSLLYLFENTGADADTFLNELTKSNPLFADIRAAKIAAGSGTVKSDHTLFRMLNTLVERSKRVVVHTQFAKHILVKTLGEWVADRVRIIPHFAISPDAAPPNNVRKHLGLPTDAFLVVTSGFATPVKRFDWLVEAMARIAKTNRRLMWVQAGPVRPEEYDLQKFVKEFPELERVTRFTGYLSESDLDSYIAASDLFFNLRYPSVGESSGSLARALAAGAASVVTDTAGYREFPDSVLFKISPSNATREIEDLVLRGIEDRTAFDDKRASAIAYARDDLSIQRYVIDFERVIEEAFTTPVDTAARPTSTILSDKANSLHGPFSLDELQFGSLQSKLKTIAERGSLRIRKDDLGWYVEVIQETC